MLRDSAQPRLASDEDEIMPLEDALVTTSRDHVILSWNRGAEMLFGWRSREVIGKHISFLFPEKHREVEALNARDALTGVVVRNSVVKAWCKDGALLSMIYTLVPMRDRDGRVNGILRICRDIQAFRTAQSALRQALRQLRQMDEVRDPLLEAMRSEPLGAPPGPRPESTDDPVTTENRRSQREYVQILSEECKAIEELTGEIRALLQAREMRLGAG